MGEEGYCVGGGTSVAECFVVVWGTSSIVPYHHIAPYHHGTVPPYYGTKIRYFLL